MAKKKEVREELEAVVEAAPVIVAVPVGITLGSVQIGTNFIYNNQGYKKINEGVVYNIQNGDDASEFMPNNAIIIPIRVGHEIEPDA